jgi:hypothetical protein
LPQFSVPTFYLNNLPDLPAFAGLAGEISARYGQEAFVGALQPADDYGSLYPYVGKVLHEDYFHGTVMRYGLVDAQGRIVVDPVFSQVGFIANGPEPGAEYLSLTYPMDKNDTKAQEIAQITDFFSIRSHHQFAKADGTWVSPLYYGDYVKLSEDRVTVVLHGDKPEEVWYGLGVKYQLYDLQGELLAEGEGSPSEFCEGLALLQHTQGANDEYFSTYSYIDKKGQTVIKGPFSDAVNFEDGKAMVALENGALFAVIDREGNYLVGPKRIGESFSLWGGAYLSFWENDKQGMMDRMGNIVLPAVYDFISHHYEGDNYLLAAQKPDQTYDIVDLRSSHSEPADESFTYIRAEQDGWLIAEMQDMEDDSYPPADMYLLRGEARHSFLATEYGRISLRYFADDIFSLCVDNGSDGDQLSVRFFDAGIGETVKTWPGWNSYSYDQTSQGSVYYLENGYFQKQLVLGKDFEPLFMAEHMAGAEAFRDIRYLKDGLFSVRTDRFGGLMRMDGSWLIRVLTRYQD